MDQALFGAALTRLWPHGNSKIPGLVPAMIAQAPVLFPKYGFTTNALVAIAMAEGSEECGCGTEVVENLNYTAAQLLHQWPKHFSPAQAMQMQHQQWMIADQAYNGRMGNRPFTDDGYDKRGRGFTQPTGVDGYAKLQAALAKHGVVLDLANNPDLVNDPKYFLECGLVDFIECGCMPYALQNNFAKVTEKLNGGETGEDMRLQQWALWKHALGVA